MNVKDKKKILAYSSTGQAKVTMMFFGTALKNAVSNSIKYMVNYLVTGLTT
jgi:NADH:ubiquinone oxidoreductase subunit 5 (subunit L)/multisubunit Na+/H+ antiporter MnhA subunit